jgi:multidrug transporter EmrE-like cation transporter
MFLKLGLDGSGSGEEQALLGFLRSAFGTWHVWLGLTLFATSVLIWMRVLSTTELSWGYPLLGLSYVFVALLGWLVFQEQLGLSRLVGIALVLIGAALIARS